MATQLVADLAVEANLPHLLRQAERAGFTYRQIQKKCHVSPNTIRKGKDGLLNRRAALGLAASLTTLLSSAASAQGGRPAADPKHLFAVQTKLTDEYRNLALESFRDAEGAAAFAAEHVALLGLTRADDPAFRLPSWLKAGVFAGGEVAGRRGAHPEFTVSVMADSPSPAAAALRLRDAADRLPFHTTVRFDGRTGAEQIAKLKAATPAPDFAVLGLPSRCLAAADRDANPATAAEKKVIAGYRLIAPLFEIHTSLMARERDNPKAFLLLNGGFGELFGIHWEKAKPNSGVKIIPVDAPSPLAVADRVKDRTGILCYEPVASLLVGRELVRVDSHRPYKVLVGLFCNSELFPETSQRRQEDARLFTAAFVREFKAGHGRFLETAEYLLADPAFAAAFAAVVGTPAAA